jgi:predicted transcriptional regulator
MKKMTIKEMAIEFNNIIIELNEINIEYDFTPVKKFSTRAIGERRLELVQGLLRDARIKAAKNEKPKKVGRKTQVLAILQNGETTMTMIAEALNISKKNISSILTYLRKEGYVITTKRNGKNHIVTIRN